MPTLFRLVLVIGAFVGLCYGAMIAVVALVRPVPHEIVEAVALPQSVELHSGRSAADVLNSQASALVHHERRHHRDQR